MVSRKRRWDLDDQAAAAAAGATASPIPTKAPKLDIQSDHDQATNGAKASPGASKDANTAACKFHCFALLTVCLM